MSLRADLERRGRDTRFVVAALGVLLVILGAGYWFLLQSRDLPSFLVTNKLLLFVLFYLDVVLILAIVFVLVRNVAKLMLERRSRVLGSRFKFRLLTTLVGLTLIPVLLVFLYASELLEKSVDRWFEAPGVDALRQGAEVSQALRRSLEEAAIRDAELVAGAIPREGELDPEQRAQIAALLSSELARLRVDLLATFRDNEFVHGVVAPRGGLEVLPDLPRSFLQQAASEGSAARWVSPGADDSARLVLGSTATAAAGSPRITVVAGRLVEARLAADSERLIVADQSLRRAELQTAEIKSSQLLLFLLVTLLVLLTSSWIGLRLARRFTTPIQALAEGTRRISEGELSHRVVVDADDELGVLVDSFNSMTAELERNEQLLEARNRELADANERIDGERALLLAVLHSVAAGVVALDRHGVVFLSNGAALRMLDQTEDQVVGRTLDQAWGDASRQPLLAALHDEQPVGKTGSRTVRLVLAGAWKSIELTATALPERGGERGGLVIVLEDLTELVKAQKLAAWSEAARRIAHEIRNPLTPIQLAAERMLHQYRAQVADLEGALSEGVETIVREVGHLKTMVDEFSRFARLPAPQPTRLDAGKLVEEISRLYRSVKAGVEIRVDLEGPLEGAWADRERLRGALVNLIDNAFEATDPPGSVTVAARLDEGRLILRVADTGRGIPTDDVSKLFLPHFSTKGRGTGLGLAIVHRTVSEHHGTIRVEDNHPHGTVFTIELPVPARELTVADEPAISG